MAQNKKSFVLYADFIHAFNQLTDEEAGQLIKHIFGYVNDENPVLTNRLLIIAFEPIKQQLKRDLVKWDGKLSQWSEAGKASAKARQLRKSTTVNDRSKSSTVSSVNVNDNVNVNVINIEYKKNYFFTSLTPFIEIYGKDLINDFAAYWMEPTQNGKKTRKDLQKTWDTARRLATWAKNDKNFNSKTKHDVRQNNTNNLENLKLAADTIINNGANN